MSEKQEEPTFKVVRSHMWEEGSMASLKSLREGRELPAGVVGCKICNKTIHQIFVEHLEDHLK